MESQIMKQTMIYALEGEVMNRVSHLIVIFSLLLSSCTASIGPVLERRPLVQPLPLTIGVYYGPEFRSYTRNTSCIDYICFKYDLGMQSVTMFEQILASMFDSVVPIETLSPPLDLSRRPLTRNRIEEMDVRYIVIVTGQTTSEMDGSWGSGGGGGAGYAGKSGVLSCGYNGCLGLMAWKRKSELSAIVWDLKTGVRAGTIDVEVAGTNVMPAFILPIALIAPTEMAACSEIGEHVARFITTGELPAEPTVEVPTNELSSK